MLTKHLLAISLALPIFAMSASAYAGATISDKRYWPSEARSGTAAGSAQSSIFACLGAAHDNASADPEESAAPPACCDASMTAS